MSEDAAVPGVPAVAAVCCRPGARPGAALLLQSGNYVISDDVPSIYDIYTKFTSTASSI